MATVGKMSVLTEKELRQMEADAKQYDYIRFSWPDMNGVLRGKTVIGRYAPGSIRNGVGEFTGTIVFSPDGGEKHEIPAITNAGCPNSQFVPSTTIIPLPWAGNGKYKVGQVLCEAFWQSGEQVNAASRTVARKQFERLRDVTGFELYSAFEAEFIVFDAKTQKPVFNSNAFAIDTTLSENADWIFDVEKQLAEIGINIGAMHNEFSPGQFECCMAPEYGIKTADNMMIFRQAVKEITTKYGRQATFMTYPYAGGSSGFHLNHSLWKDGKCVFYDVNKPDHMSDVMRYWVGGLMKHMTSLLALCCPTPNCYRRLHQPWCPSKQNWGIDNRMAALRVKTLNEQCCLVENRLPSSACNEYLVAAATIAAGLDGIENKIEPPARGVHDDDAVLPAMEAALKALEENDVMRQSLGEEFITWYLATKRANEVMLDDLETERDIYTKIL